MCVLLNREAHSATNRYKIHLMSDYLLACTPLCVCGDVETESTGSGTVWYSYAASCNIC